MKKRIIVIAAMLLMAIIPLRSQIFIVSEDEWNDRNRAGTNPGVMVPEQNVTYDQYVPLGQGVLLLAGLGAAYLLRKRKKD